MKSWRTMNKQRRRSQDVRRLQRIYWQLMIRQARAIVKRQEEREREYFNGAFTITIRRVI